MGLARKLILKMDAIPSFTVDLASTDHNVSIRV